MRGDIGVNHRADLFEEADEFVSLDLTGSGSTSVGRFMMQTLGVSPLLNRGSEGGGLLDGRLGLFDLIYYYAIETKISQFKGRNISPLYILLKSG